MDDENDEVEVDELLSLNSDSDGDDMEQLPNNHYGVRHRHDSEAHVGIDEPIDPAEISVYDLTEFTCDPVKVAEVWLQAAKDGTLSKDQFQEHLRIFVPKVLFKGCPQFSQARLYTDEEVNCILIEPLQRFCFNNIDPCDIQTIAEGSNDPSAICGHVFQIGEPTYTCRDCGLDPTCVLCVECFNQSAHRNHRYKMSTSSGGGYCDCGDSEAWKQHESCTAHKTSKITEDHPGCSLSEAEIYRAKLLFEFIVEYAMLLLTYQYAVNPPVPFCLTEEEVTKLEVKSVEKTYACILYNDESHTFELVIQTLVKALQTSKRSAIEFATQIDRDGRAIVFSGSFMDCEKVKDSIKKNTRLGSAPLQTQVLHGFVVSHQHVASCLLTWLRDVVAVSSSYRYIFFQVLTSKHLGEPRGVSNLEVLMASDTKFWKSIRVQWHHLFISGLLKEYYMKKVFASAFGKLYCELMKDFIADDHDHIYSVSALSVQIFTVPTLAHYLIEEHDVFYNILRTFMSECEQKLHDGKVKFDNSTAQFKRTHFAIMDLKYLLTTPPTSWNDDLRKSFQHGTESFIKLLSWLQETDPVVRQTGTHVEFEPEWEAAFNTHIKLSPVISLVLDWCATDEGVCTKAYKCAMRYISSLKYQDKMTTVVRELADHSATCYDFDIATRPVSIHLALTRIYAGICVHLEKFNLSSFDASVHIEAQPSPEILMEPALRALCLSAQCHAGMWKRNGYSLLNQMYFYHNVRCRADMYDRDVVALQIAASVIESNEFLIHVLNRIGILQWIDDIIEVPAPKDEDQTLNNMILLVEEFFQLIITIVSARFNPGVGMVTSEDCVRKQIVQALCISPMQHSELNKLLVEDVYGETGIEAVIKSVTTCKRTTQGDIYELLPEFYSDYDVFHHHYTREDMSKAEQQQRTRKKAANEPDCFPPPNFPRFSENFNMVVNVLKSDVMLHLMVIVMTRGLKAQPRSFSDPQLRRVLHLIGIALNEEATRSETDPEHFFQFTQAAREWKIFDLLADIFVEPKFAVHKDLVGWLLRRCKEVRPDQPMDLDRETAYSKENDPSQADENKKKIAAERRAFLLARMNQQQQNFRTVNEDLFEPEAVDIPQSGTEDVEMIPEDGVMVALGVKQTPVTLPEEIHKCILCQEEHQFADTAPVFVLACYVQQSSVHAQDRRYLVDSVTDEHCPITLEPHTHIRARDSLVLHSDLMQSVHVGSCGHEMHLTCWDKYFRNVQSKERRRPYRFRHPVSFDVDEKEYLCPLCERLSNCVLPLSPPLPLLQRDDAEHEVFIHNVTYLEWLDHMNFLIENTREIPVDKGGEYEEVGVYTKSEDMMWELKFREYNCPIRKHPDMTDRQKDLTVTFWRPRYVPGTRVPEYIQDSIDTFQSAIYGLNPRAVRELPASAPQDSRKISRSMLEFWQSVAFTILSAEMVHRDQGIPFFGIDVKTSQSSTLTYLVRAAALHANFSDEFSLCVLQSLGLKLLGLVLENGPEGSRSAVESLLDIDAFSLLVSLTFSLPAQFDFEGLIELMEVRAPPCGRMQDFFLMKTMLMYHITQVLYQNKGFGVWCQSSNPLFKSEPGIQENNNFVKFFLAILPQEQRNQKRAAAESGYWSIVFGGLMETITPFLRCCCKFYECLTGVEPKRLASPEATYMDMLEFLGLPTTAHELFTPMDQLLHISQRWILSQTNAEASVKLHGITPITCQVVYPRVAPPLVELPLDYMDLINSVSSFTCKNSDSCLESRMPTMCLVCGTVLCSQSYCCQREMRGNTVGACTFHSHICGAGMGLFLRIRDCKVFYLGGKLKPTQSSAPISGRSIWDHENLLKGIYVPPPYLDEYGESDPGLRRGNPMKLDVEKYKMFRKLWLSHGIPAEISRHTERSTSVVTTEWQYL